MDDRVTILKGTLDIRSIRSIAKEFDVKSSSISRELKNMKKLGLSPIVADEVILSSKLFK